MAASFSAGANKINDLLLRHAEGTFLACTGAGTIPAKQVKGL
jgi:hypothetical protein